MDTGTEAFVEFLEQDAKGDESMRANQEVAAKLLKRLDEATWKTWAPRLAKRGVTEKVPAVARDRIETITADRGGYELILVRGGTFLMGSPDTELERRSTEGPRREVQVEGFYLGRCAVTNEEYARFLEAKPGTQTPKYWKNTRWNRPNQPGCGHLLEGSHGLLQVGGAPAPKRSRMGICL